MVRIKERYLLVNLVYPDESLNQGKTHVPDLLVYNQPTPNTVTSYSLLKTIKTEVASLFGDYGAGAIERSLQGVFRPHLIWFLLYLQLHQLSICLMPPRHVSCDAHVSTIDLSGLL